MKLKRIQPIWRVVRTSVLLFASSQQSLTSVGMYSFVHSLIHFTENVRTNKMRKAVSSREARRMRLNLIIIAKYPIRDVQMNTCLHNCVFKWICLPYVYGKHHLLPTLSHHLLALYVTVTAATATTTFSSINVFRCASKGREAVPSPYITCF